MNPAVRSMEESVNRAREAERLGYESVWVTQLPDARDAALVLAAYAAATQWVRLGTGVLPIYTRRPTAMAQMAATLDDVLSRRTRALLHDREATAAAAQSVAALVAPTLGWSAAEVARQCSAFESLVAHERECVGS